MTAVQGYEKALLRGLAQVSLLLQAYEAQATHSTEERYQYVRLCRVRRALKHDCYKHQEEMVGNASGLWWMHVQAALAGMVHFPYAITEAEAGSYADPTTWQVDKWVAPSGEGL